MTRFVVLSCLALAVIGLSGCPFDAKSPIVESGSGPLDQALIGDWSAVDRESGDTTALTVFAFNAGEYYVEIRGEDGATERYRAVPFFIENALFLQINEIPSRDDSSSFIFARYKVSPDGGVSISFVGEDAIARDMKDDPAAFAKTIASRMNDPLLYDRDTAIDLRRLERSPQAR